MNTQHWPNLLPLSFKAFGLLSHFELDQKKGLRKNT